MTTYTIYVCDVCGVEQRNSTYSMSTLPALRKINGNSFEDEANGVHHLCAVCWKAAFKSLDVYFDFIRNAKVNNHNKK